MLIECGKKILVGDEPLNVQHIRNKKSLMAQLFCPFPNNTSTVLLGSSFVGKTFYLKYILEHYPLFFSGSIEKVIVLHCREFVQFPSLEGKENFLPPVEEYLLSEFNFDNIQPNCIIIIEDLQNFTLQIKSLINLSVHHQNLLHLFIITHGLLNSSTFSLLSYVHRVVFFLRAKATVRAVKYILQTFFSDPETKTYLQNIISFCENRQEILHLEINTAAGRQQPSHIALSHLLELKDNHYCIAYPFLHKMSDYELETNSIEEIELAEPSKVPSVEGLPSNAFIVLSQSQVQHIKLNSGKDVNPEQSLNVTSKGPTEHISLQDSEGCSSEKDWENIYESTNQDLENFLPANKLFQAKILLKEILQNPNLCISSDGRLLRPKKEKQAQISLIDFIKTCIRSSGPKETLGSGPYSTCRKIVSILLSNNTPKTIFKNKLLFQPLKSKKKGKTIRSKFVEKNKKSSQRSERTPPSLLTHPEPYFSPSYQTPSVIHNPSYRMGLPPSYYPY